MPDDSRRVWEYARERLGEAWTWAELAADLGRSASTVMKYGHGGKDVSMTDDFRSRVYVPGRVVRARRIDGRGKK